MVRTRHRSVAKSRVPASGAGRESLANRARRPIVAGGQIEWRTRRVYVEPSAEHGRGAWIGSGQGLSHYVASAVKRVLTSNADSAVWSTRAREALERIRPEFYYVKADGNNWGR